MLNRYYDSFRTPSLDFFDAFKIFEAIDNVYKSDTIDDEGIKIELPGVKPSDVDVSLEGRTIKITGKSRHSKEFKYLYKLNSSVDDENITASLHDGLLSIIIPKKSEQAARKITVKS